jgi:NAD(P) transhydrogenase subunit alpha
MAMDTSASLAQRAGELAGTARSLTNNLDLLANQIGAMNPPAAAGGGDFVFHLTVFALACFVGYYVVWRVTPALHSPLMAVTNAVSSVIIVGALIAAGPVEFTFSKFMGFLAVILASVNIFGGFIVTQRMLQMFKKKAK